MLLYAHSGVRYLVLLAGLACLAYAVYGLLSSRPYDRAMMSLGRTFAGLVHLQVLLGFGVLVGGPFHTQLIGHLIMMALAAILAQLPVSVLRRRPDADRSYGPHAVLTALALLVIAGGILAIGRLPWEMAVG